MAIGATTTGAKGDETRERLKKCARELFSRYGIDAVTIREIATRAGQKNGGSINYYFRSKEDLVLEILNDAASESDRSRGVLLDRLEMSGKTLSIRDILKVLISHEPNTDENRRLFAMLQLHRRDLMHTAIPGHWDQAYRRCVVHLRELLPNYGEEILSQRLYFVIPHLWTFLATRESSEEQAKFWKDFWADPSTIESLLDTAEGILVHPPSPDTLAALKTSRSPAPSQLLSGAVEQKKGSKTGPRAKKGSSLKTKAAKARRG
jgi:AcrR family transcriptional regulator